MDRFIFPPCYKEILFKKMFRVSIVHFRRIYPEQETAVVPYIVFMLSVVTILFLPLARKHKSALAIIIISLFSGLRYGIGTDYFRYYRNFLTANFKTFGDVEGEVGDLLLNRMVGILTQNPIAMMTVYAFLTSTLIVIGLVVICDQLSLSFEIAVLSYISLGPYFSSFNLTKQELAVSIVLIAFVFILKKRTVCAVFLLALASTFHLSAVFIAPFLLILNSRKLAFLSVIVLGGVLFFNYSAFITLIQTSFLPYSFYADTRYLRSGANLLNFLAPLALSAVLFVFERKNINSIYEYKVIFRLLLLACLFYALSVRGLLLARIAIYFWIISPVAVSLLIKGFTKSEKPLILWIVGVCLLSYAILYISNYGGIVPYRSFITF